MNFNGVASVIPFFHVAGWRASTNGLTSWDLASTGLLQIVNRCLSRMTKEAVGVGSACENFIAQNCPWSVLRSDQRLEGEHVFLRI